MVTKICIGCCAKDSVYVLTVRSLLAIQYELFKNGHDMIPAFNMQDSLITRCRDKIATDFLVEPVLADSTHLFFIDSDIYCPVPGAILKLIEADKDVIAGIYRVKSDEDYRPAVVPLNKKTTMEHFRQPVECEYVSTGFLLIKREVLETLMDKVETYGIGKHTMYHFFPSYILDQEDFNGDIFRNLISEDWGFSKLCRDNGITLYAMDVGLSHIGLKGYEFDR